MMLPRHEIEQALPQFIGTNGYHRVSPFHGKLVLTDGVKWLADNAACHWLVDIVASYQPECRKDPMLQAMQFWTLSVADDKGIVICERDTGNVAFRQAVPFTDFPLDEIKIWVEPGETEADGPVMVAMLPGER
jgi:hypothetical protein